MRNARAVVDCALFKNLERLLFKISSLVAPITACGNNLTSCTPPIAIIIQMAEVNQHIVEYLKEVSNHSSLLSHHRCQRALGATLLICALTQMDCEVRGLLLPGEQAVPYAHVTYYRGDVRDPRRC